MLLCKIIRIDALHAVRVYVEQHRLNGRRACVEQGGVSDKPLFLLETGHGLTENGILILIDAKGYSTR